MQRPSGVGLLTLVVGLNWGCDTIRYWEYNKVLAKLREIPGVTILSSGGNEDVTFEDIHATVAIRGRGAIRFSGLEASSFTNAEYLTVTQVGDHYPSVVGYGFWGVVKTATGEPVKTIFIGGSLRLEPKSHFAGLFQSRFGTIQDVVAGYDEIVAVLSTWPECPSSAPLTGADGSEYRYCVNRGDASKEPEYPQAWFPEREWLQGQAPCSARPEVPPNNRLQQTSARGQARTRARC